MESLLYYIFAVPSILIASTFHEFAHAWTADRLGDSTPRMQGRLTLNPLRHLDPIGAVSLILFQFGWSKPVVVNPYSFRRPVIDNAIVAAAGPISNLILIILTAIPLRIAQLFLSLDSYETVITFALPFLIINASFMIFNLIPIPPLDGSRIVKVILPEGMQDFWENLDRFGFLLLLPFIIDWSPLSGVLSWVLNNGIMLVLRPVLGI